MSNDVEFPKQENGEKQPAFSSAAYAELAVTTNFSFLRGASHAKDLILQAIAQGLTGIVTRQGQKLIAIHCMADHTHILIGLKPNIALSDLVGDIKTGSTNHINEKRWVTGRFSWQEGFGAFSYSHSQLSGVIKYIQEQEKHHARKTFRQEYLAFLKKFEVRYDERYIFKSLDEE